MMRLTSLLQRVVKQDQLQQTGKMDNLHYKSLAFLAVKSAAVCQHTHSKLSDFARPAIHKLDNNCLKLNNLEKK